MAWLGAAVVPAVVAKSANTNLGSLAPAAPRVSLPERLGVLRDLLRRAASFSFDEAVRGADRMTVAVTVFALLELYKRGEAAWEQEEPFGPITVRADAGGVRPEAPPGAGIAAS